MQSQACLMHSQSGSYALTHLQQLDELFGA
eukprot:SAG11_NODE_7543_length_1131_cov_1.265504_3_plen_29_part_01